MKTIIKPRGPVGAPFVQFIIKWHLHGQFWWFKAPHTHYALAVDACAKFFVFFNKFWTLMHVIKVLVIAIIIINTNQACEQRVSCLPCPHHINFYHLPPASVCLLGSTSISCCLACYYPLNVSSTPPPPQQATTCLTDQAMSAIRTEIEHLIASNKYSFLLIGNY